MPCGGDSAALGPKFPALKRSRYSGARNSGAAAVCEDGAVRPASNVIKTLILACLSSANCSRGEHEAYRILNDESPRSFGTCGATETLLIASQAELEAHRSQGRDLVKFGKALAKRPIDFAREALLLVRHTEGGTGAQVQLATPRYEAGASERGVLSLNVTAKRESREGGHAMQHYCMPVVLKRRKVEAVRVSLNGTPGTEFSISPTIGALSPPAER